MVDNVSNELGDDVKLGNDTDERLQRSLEVHFRSIVFAELSVGTSDDNGEVLHGVLDDTVDVQLVDIGSIMDLQSKLIKSLNE